MKVVVTADIPDWLGWAVFGRKMPRLHVAEGGRVVTLHLDLIIGEGMLRHRKDLGNQPVGGPRKTVGTDNLARTIGPGRYTQKDVDLVGKDRAEEFPVARVDADRIAVDGFLDLFPIHQPLNFLAVGHDISPVRGPVSKL